MPPPRALVKECGVDASTANKNGATPVFKAAQNGHTATLRALVQVCGADASNAKNDGATPVYIAAHHGHTEPVRTLVQKCGADASTANKAVTRMASLPRWWPSQRATETRHPAL